jgi:hypothetical protein
MADANIVLTSVALSGTIVQGINWLKQSKYAPWITKEKVMLLRGLSAVGAAATGAGITHVWSSADHSFLVSGLTITAVLSFLKAMWIQIVGQETIYQATKRTSAPEVVQVAKEIQQVLPEEVKLPPEPAK